MPSETGLVISDDEREVLIKHYLSVIQDAHPRWEKDEARKDEITRRIQAAHNIVNLAARLNTILKS